MMITRREASALYGAEWYSVYVVGSRAGQPVKVGIARQLIQRLGSLQCASPVKLRFLDIRAFPRREAAQRCEQAVHAWLRARGRHLHGEWFDARPEELAEAFDNHDYQTIEELRGAGFFVLRDQHHPITAAPPARNLADLMSSGSGRPVCSVKLDGQAISAAEHLLAALLHQPALVPKAIQAGLRKSHFRDGLRRAYDLAVNPVADPYPCAGTRAAVALAALRVNASEATVYALVKGVSSEGRARKASPARPLP